MSTNQDISSNLRNKSRIDYKVLNNSGQLVLKPSLLSNTNSQPETSEMMSNNKPNEKSSSSASSTNNESDEVIDMSSQLNNLQISSNSNILVNTDSTNLRALKRKYELLHDEIDDFIDENPPNITVISIHDIDSCIETITAFRTQFRQIVQEIQENLSEDDFDSSYSKDINSILARIKEYVINAKDRKSEIRCKEEESDYSEKAIQIKKIWKKILKRKDLQNS